MEPDRVQDVGGSYAGVSVCKGGHVHMSIENQHLQGEGKEGSHHALELHTRTSVGLRNVTGVYAEVECCDSAC